MATIEKNLGIVTAYGYAKAHGYTGTEEEFAILMASYATVADEAAESAGAAGRSAQASAASAEEAAQKVLDAQAQVTLAQAQAQAAAQSATDASGFATAASGSAANAAASATEAQTQAQASGGSAAQALASKNAAQAYASNAETSKTQAAEQVTLAAEEVAKATQQATNAGLSATAAAGSATAAADSATEAAASAEAAEASAQSIDVDTLVHKTELSETLEDYAKVDGAYENMTVGNAEQLVSTVGITDETPYNFRTSGGSVDIGDRETVKAVVGGTVVWNQLAALDASKWKTARESITFSGNKTILSPTVDTTSQKAAWFTIAPNHKYLVTGLLVGAETNFGLSMGIYKGQPSGTQNDVVRQTIIYTGDDISVSKVWNSGEEGVAFGFNHGSNATTSSVTTFDNLQVIDLTQMFGSAIADYIYSLEQANEGAGVAWFRKLFSKPYYPYSEPTMLSVKTSAHKTVGFNAYNPTTGTAKVVGGMQYQITGAYTALTLDGAEVTPDANGYFTPNNTGTLTVTGGNATDTCVHLVWDGELDGEWAEYEEHEYPLDSELELRGIPKLDANNQLYYDGDTYEPDGTVMRRAVVRTFDGSESWRAGNNAYGADTQHFYVEIGALNSVKSGVGLCDKYQIGLASSNTFVGFQIINSTARNLAGLYIRPENVAEITSLADFKALLAENPITVVWLLADGYTTTETADSYQETQIVDDFGTEEYVDTREVAIPVGHETVYAPNLRAKLEMAPDSPDGNGDYIVRQTNGQNVYIPYSEVKELPSFPSEDGSYHLEITVASGTPTLSWVANS